ncbi:AP-4 complex subunit sigma-1, partial [Conglomerata obtusa]
MILQVLGFCEDGTTRFFRRYVKTHLDHEEIKNAILKCSSPNVIDKKQSKIIFERFGNVYIAFVVDMNENEFFVFDLIRRFVGFMDTVFVGVSNIHLVHNFDVILTILDEFIVNGKVMELTNNQVGL